ncbi:MAG TPA: lytic transglycosylase domain-containing protein [Paraburkholderia sp.]
MFSLVGAAQTVNAQVAASAVPAALPAVVIGTPDEAQAPAASDIVAMLRKQFRVTRSDSMRIAQAVLTEANRYAMSPMLLLAVMSVESGFDRHAVSSVGARGLMQILPAAHPRLLAGVRDLSDPAINVRIGSAILRDYIDAADGDLEAALRRYSGGSRGYARRVVLRMHHFDESLPATADGPADETVDAPHAVDLEAQSVADRIE